MKSDKWAASTDDRIGHDGHTVRGSRGDVLIGSILLTHRLLCQRFPYLSS